MDALVAAVVVLSVLVLGLLLAVFALTRQIGIPYERLNVNGRAIAIGHPYGISGQRLTGHARIEGKCRGGRRGGLAARACRTCVSSRPASAAATRRPRSVRR